MSNVPKWNDILQDKDSHDRNMLLSQAFSQEGVQIYVENKEFVVNYTKNKVFNQIRLMKS